MKTLRGTKVKICMLILVLLIQVASPLLTIMVENSFTLTTLGAETEETTWDISANGDGSITAVLDEEGTLTITGTGAMKTYDIWTYIPWYSSRSNIKEVVIEDGVTNIAKYAFYDCNALTTIKLPNSVTSIGKKVFYNCSALTTAELSDNVTSIGEHTFYGCKSLAKIELPNGLINIAEESFSGCSALTTIVIPDGITNIGAKAFYNCAALNKIELPDSVTSIGESAFAYCSMLTKVSLPSGLATLKNSTFYGCSSLVSIELPDGITSIGSYAFHKCTSLAKLDLPDAVVNVGNGAFYGCKALASIKLSSELSSIPQDCFCECTSLSTVVLPNGIISIGDYAFAACTNLSSVYIPSSVESISTLAFKKYVLSSANNINLKIYCRTGSMAEEYAIANEFSYEVEDEAPIIRKVDKKLVTEGEQKQAVITIDAVDNGVGLPNKAYSFDGGKNWQTEATKTYIENTKDIVIKVRDILGNEATYTTEIDMEKMSQTEILIYEIVEETNKKFLINISPKTTITKALENIITSGNIKIYKGETEITDNNTKLATGMKLTILVESEVADEYIIVVTGDVNGDGKADLNDILVINKYRLGKTTLTGANLLAGDVDGNGKADLNDILKINKYRLGKIDSL